MRLERIGRWWVHGVVATVVAVCAVATASAPAASSTPERLCGGSAGRAPETYRHVVVIMDENKSFSRHRRAARLVRQAPRALPEPPRQGVRTRGELPRHHPSQPPQLHGHHRRHPCGRARLKGRTSSAKSAALERRGASTTPPCPTPASAPAAYPYKPGHNPGIAWLRHRRRLPPLGRQRPRASTPISPTTRSRPTPSSPPTNATTCTPRATHGKSAVAPATTGSATWVRRLAKTPQLHQPDAPPSSSPGTKDHTARSADKLGENCLAPNHRHDQSCHVATLVLSAHTRPGTRSHQFFHRQTLTCTLARAGTEGRGQMHKGHYVQVRYPQGGRWVTVAVSDTRNERRHSRRQRIPGAA